MNAAETKEERSDRYTWQTRGGTTKLRVAVSSWSGVPYKHLEKQMQIIKFFRYLLVFMSFSSSALSRWLYSKSNKLIFQSNSDYIIYLGFGLVWDKYLLQARDVLPWVPQVFSRVRLGASFRRPQADTCSAKGRRLERRSCKKKPLAFSAGHFLRLDRNRKPRMESLWHPG